MNKYMNNILLACAVSLMFAGSYIGSKYLQPFMHPYAYTAARVGLATLFLLPFIAKREFRYFNYKRGLLFLGVGFFGYFLINHLFTLALLYAPTTNVSIVSSTLPIMMLIASCFIMRRFPSLSEVVAFVCTFVGMVLIICKKDFSSLSLQKGEILMLLSNCAGVANNLLLQKLGGYFSSLFMTAIGGLIGMMFLLPLGISDNMVADMSHLGSFEWIVLVVVAIVCTAFPFWGFSQAIINLGANTATFLIMGLGPIFVALLSYLFFGEAITTMQLFGGALVILALYFNLKNSLPASIRVGG